MSSARMVDDYLRERGIEDERVLKAMEEIPRRLFVPEALTERAYSDHPLPIGYEQTISQPYVVALMSQALGLKGTEKVLEIGTGSGYQTAVLARLARSVFSVERIHPLGAMARRRMDELSFHNVSIRVADGAHGWEEYAPFDKILVTAAADETPKALLQQLSDPGTMVIPRTTSESNLQKLYLMEKSNGFVKRRFLCSCEFVPLVS